MIFIFPSFQRLFSLFLSWYYYSCGLTALIIISSFIICSLWDMCPTSTSCFWLLRPNTFSLFYLFGGLQFISSSFFSKQTLRRKQVESYAKSKQKLQKKRKKRHKESLACTKYFFYMMCPRIICCSSKLMVEVEENSILKHKQKMTVI